MKDTRLQGTDLVVEKGTQILVSVYGLHHDPKYFPHPERFDPERFNEEETKKRPNFSYLPFGEGPRICIGEYNIQGTSKKYIYEDWGLSQGNYFFPHI